MVGSFIFGAWGCVEWGVCVGKEGWIVNDILFLIEVDYILDVPLYIIPLGLSKPWVAHMLLFMNPVLLGLIVFC